MKTKDDGLGWPQHHIETLGNLFDYNLPTQLSYSSCPWREDVGNELPWRKVTLAIVNFLKPFLKKGKRKGGEKLVVVQKLMVPCTGFPESIVFSTRPKRILGKGNFVI